MTEKTNQRIVVGVDGSADGRRALEWATNHAGPHDTIDLIHTWSAPTPIAEAGVVIDPRLFAESATAILNSDIEFAQQACGEGVTIAGRTIEGHPGRALIDASEGADMIVVGSRGRGGFMGLLLGSTSTYLAHHAECPLVIVRTPSSDKK